MLYSFHWRGFWKNSTSHWVWHSLSWGCQSSFWLTSIPLPCTCSVLQAVSFTHRISFAFYHSVCSLPRPQYLLTIFHLKGWLLASWSWFIPQSNQCVNSLLCSFLEHKKPVSFQRAKLQAHKQTKRSPFPFHDLSICSLLTGTLSSQEFQKTYSFHSFIAHLKHHFLWEAALAT